MKACTSCRLIVETGEECPQCHSQGFTEKFMGQLIVLDAEKSEIAKKIEAKLPGRYAIKIQER